MQNPISLKSAESKAFQLSFADGLWDVFIGCMFLNFAVAPFLSETMGDFWSSAIFLPFWGLVYLAIWLTRKYVVAPRIGKVVQRGHFHTGFGRGPGLSQPSGKHNDVDSWVIPSGRVQYSGLLAGLFPPVSLRLAALYIPPGGRMAVCELRRGAPRFSNLLWLFSRRNYPDRVGHLFPPAGQFPQS
jgi:hypothetical protein